ncbi:hypothetical protein FHS13_003997 [Nocardiopsis algeriensis]|uniref:Uncharacterized protein n=1 Tax=Nocardiopsis algeriensis TaxID=1478215 RepID=A0A841IV13_9ACTN|nr:hypothetical protein [Nocardiopsis algeriensis]
MGSRRIRRDAEGRSCTRGSDSACCTP